MHCPPPAPPRLKPLAQALIAASLLSAGLPGLGPVAHAQKTAPTAPPTALPSGLNIVAGQAQLAVQGAQMTVRNTPGAILNWQRFDIGAAAGVHFDQANAASKVLNRVVGNDPSQILGRLSSNGQVWLLNPHGVLFGHGARVDVASLVAGSMRMLDSDFLAGRYRLSAPEALAGSVVNQGLLTSRFGGQILLVGGSEVRNEGSINAPGGHAGLVAGRSVELVDTGLPNLAVKVTVPDHKAEVTNLGRLATPGGRIDIYAGIVNQKGLVEAQSLSVGERGEIVLQASDTLMLHAGSRTDASGQGSARGGRIDISAPQIGLVGDAQVDASGATGGGIRIGGGLRGQEADIAHARALFMGAQARVNADGRDGDGGRIVLWSDSVTRGHGQLSARGGLLGQGGFIEVSSKGVLDWGGSADLRVADLNPARYGTLLLDPEFIVIQQSSPSLDGVGTGDLASPNLLFGAFPGATSVITAGALNTQLASANVVLQANLDITVGATTTPISGTRALTLQAGRDIIVNGAITANSGITLSANDPAGTDTGIGRVIVNAALNAGANPLVITNNGGSGVHSVAANLTAGNLAITGETALSGTRTFNLTSSTASVGALSGTGSLVKAGTGVLNVNGAATLTDVTVNAGTLAFNGSTALTTLTVSGGVLSGSGDVTVAGSFSATGTSAVLGGTGTLNTAGTSTVNFSAAGAALQIEDSRRWVNSGTVNLDGDDRLLFDRTAGTPSPTLVNTGSERILFDTGLDAVGVTAALAAAGYTPADVTHVVLTHMHPDHIGGLTDDSGAATFANAAYVAGQAEFDFWAAQANEGFEAKVRPQADRMTFIGDGGAVRSGITGVAAFGHSSGHMTYMLESGGAQLMLIADTANHHVWSLAYPDWEVRFDADKAAAAATRRAILGMAAADRFPIIGYHLPFPAAGYVETRGDGFHYVPVSYQLG
jgi:filamentous hemagglutinin family protein